MELIDGGNLPQLDDINFQGNNLGDEGAQSLTHAYYRGTLIHVRHLNISQNSIGGAGGKALWLAYSSDSIGRLSPLIEVLDMRRNCIPPTVAHSMDPCPVHMKF
jgi:hypothetical protein